MIEIKQLTADTTEGWHYFPYAAVRVFQFCKKYDSDADPALMIAQLKLAFVRPELGVSTWLLFVDGVVRGHALVSMEEWFGTKMATIVQVEADVPVQRRQMKETLETIEAWAIARGAKFVQIVALDEKLARVYRTLYGFGGQKTLMRKSLSTGVVEDAGTSVQSRDAIPLTTEN